MENIKLEEIEICKRALDKQFEQFKGITPLQILEAIKILVDHNIDIETIKSINNEFRELTPEEQDEQDKIPKPKLTKKEYQEQYRKRPENKAIALMKTSVYLKKGMDCSCGKHITIGSRYLHNKSKFHIKNKK